MLPHTELVPTTNLELDESLPNCVGKYASRSRFKWLDRLPATNPSHDRRQECSMMPKTFSMPETRTETVRRGDDHQKKIILLFSSVCQLVLARRSSMPGQAYIHTEVPDPRGQVVVQLLNVSHITLQMIQKRCPGARLNVGERTPIEKTSAVLVASARHRPCQGSASPSVKPCKKIRWSSWLSHPIFCAI